MGQIEGRRCRVLLAAALLGAVVSTACPGPERPDGCEGIAVDGSTTLKQASTTRTGESPCVVSIYGDSIGTDTSSQKTQYVVDSIGTDTSSAASRAHCVGRFVAEGRTVQSKDGPASGGCRVRAFFDSIGTDTSTVPPRILYGLDSIGTDTIGTDTSAVRR